MHVNQFHICNIILALTNGLFEKIFYKHCRIDMIFKQITFFLHKHTVRVKHHINKIWKSYARVYEEKFKILHKNTLEYRRNYTILSTAPITITWATSLCFIRNQLRKFIGVVPEIKGSYGNEICSFFVGGTNMFSKVAHNELMAWHTVCVSTLNSAPSVQILEREA